MMLQTKEVKRIYVDMDDTIADFKNAYHIALHRDPETKYPQSQHGFFRGLAILDNADWFLQALADMGHDVWILTRPSTLNRLCYTEKADWVFEHLGQEWVDKLILCPDKGLLKGDLLIDDVEWPEFEGRHIQYGKGEYDSWRKIFIAIWGGKFWEDTWIS